MLHPHLPHPGGEKVRRATGPDRRETGPRDWRRRIGNEAWRRPAITLAVRESRDGLFQEPADLRGGLWRYCMVESVEVSVDVQRG